ncbi:DNA-binding NarL/FixJ family response regulator [Streptomyces zagrosensis]|uniref:DNA-binding NarL/FixJ family response regulator n=2 Tax=Streptomyces zagrosensis TaxID=1042984 RepID=A0A7W9V239_9ACTN|nr:DNA-binding NarL/FixJ family response regulator [Streptomyces zagrosensis]
MIDRSMELETLDSAIAGCLSGSSRIVFVEGPSGCGKSEFIENIAERAEKSGATLLRAVGSDRERAVPLGALRQLITSAPAGTLPQITPAESAGLVRVEAMHEFCAALRRLSTQSPVVVCVDDLQHVDDSTLQYLLYAARRTRSARILLVLAESLHEHTSDPVFGTELLRLPHFERVRLERLDRAGVAELAQGYAGLPQGDVFIDGLYAISGGNPLLLRALVEEHRATPPAHRSALPSPKAGGPFTQAVLTCLHRGGQATVRLAEALAVLRGAGSVESAGRLLGTSEAAASQAVHALNAAGIADGCGFRHPAVGAAILHAMEPADRAALHRDAACLLHSIGAPSPVVAAHLLAAGDADARWGVAALRDAAEQALADDDVSQAVACLTLAHQTCTDDQRGSAIKIRLAAVTWRVDPGAAEEHTWEPLVALRAGRLAESHMTSLARLLLTQGRVDEATEVLDRLADVREEGGGHAPNAMRGTTVGAQFGYPAATGSRAVVSISKDADGAPTVTLTEGAAARPAAGMWTVPATAEGEVAAAAAERFLQTAVLTDTTIEPIGQALRTLVHGDRPDRAMPWCQSFLEEADRRNAPGWKAAFAQAQAVIMIRQGNLRAAEEYATMALDCLPEKNSSVFACAPRSILIYTATAQGRHGAAARQLNHPVPDGLFRTVYALSYLRARGSYHLATNCFHAALSDFLEVGRLARRWGLDRAVVVPWRSDAAEALVHLGDRQQAEQLVMEQLAMGDARNARVRGVSLRVRAAIAEVSQRPRLLAEAVDELRKYGDRLELSRALSDLGQAFQAVGEPARASMVTRRAWHLAKECGIESVRERSLPGHHSRTAPAQEDPLWTADSEADAKLSDSEKRVAVLAAYGYTNREIALKLYVTVSTVEQHLTRVYRKLNITRRQELPMNLQLNMAEIA